MEGELCYRWFSVAAKITMKITSQYLPKNYIVIGGLRSIGEKDYAIYIENINIIAKIIADILFEALGGKGASSPSHHGKDFG